MTISKVLENAPAPYARAYELVETDDNDLTYFLLHQEKRAERALSQRRSTRTVRSGRELVYVVGPKLNKLIGA